MSALREFLLLLLSLLRFVLQIHFVPVPSVLEPVAGLGFGDADQIGDFSFFLAGRIGIHVVEVLEGGALVRVEFAAVAQTGVERQIQIELIDGGGGAAAADRHQRPGGGDGRRQFRHSVQRRRGRRKRRGVEDVLGVVVVSLLLLLYVVLVGDVDGQRRLLIEGVVIAVPKVGKLEEKMVVVVEVVEVVLVLLPETAA